MNMNMKVTFGMSCGSDVMEGADNEMGCTQSHVCVVLVLMFRPTVLQTYRHIPSQKLQRHLHQFVGQDVARV